MDFDKIKIFSYEDFVGKIISEYDNMYVFLDYFSNSGGIYIEDLLYNKINKVQYAIRQDSKSNILIQITDLLLGLFTRDSNNIESIYKKELVQYANSSKIKDKIIFLKNKKK